MHLIVGHSHSFDAPILRTRDLIASGAFGAVRMIQALNYTDFLRRPRRPEELDTAQGGGAVFNQAAHQVDIVRLLGGGRVKACAPRPAHGMTTRPTEGAYSALLTFEDGAFASLTYGGYGHFDSDEFHGWVGEMGQAKTPLCAQAAVALRTPTKRPRSRMPATTAARPISQPPRRTLAHQHFGTIIVSCERADLRPMPNGVMIYQDGAARLDPLPPPAVPRAEVIDELYDAVVHGKPPLHDGAWAMATLEVCLAMLHSVARGPRHRARASGRVVSARTETILRHWREAVPDDRLAHLVKDATRALVRALQMRLAGHKVSFGHWTFLRILWEGDGLTQRELSDEAGVMEPTTFSALKAMERLGYIRRQRGADRKKVYVFLTPKGRALKRVLVPLAEEVNPSRRAACVGPTSRRRAPCCSRIIENLAREEAAQDKRMPSTRALARIGKPLGTKRKRASKRA